MEIKYLNSKESFGMSGPWIGTLQIDNRILQFEFLDNNFVKNENGLLFAFNRFRFKNEKVKFFFNLFNTNHSKREFQILIFDSENDKWYLSNNIYKSLFLTRMEKGKIFFTLAFHNDDEQMFPEKFIAFNDKQFTELKRTEILKNALQHSV
mgnify:CR=1 FL=1|tara:strand:- start:51 stop:503 length:453 start_codon:yes stop_codon:yes gene_type:complete